MFLKYFLFKFFFVFGVNRLVAKSNWFSLPIFCAFFGIGATIRTHQYIQCLPYAVFLFLHELYFLADLNCLKFGKFTFQNLSAAAKKSKLLQKRVPVTKLRNVHCLHSFGVFGVWLWSSSFSSSLTFRIFSVCMLLSAHVEMPSGLPYMGFFLLLFHMPPNTPHPDLSKLPSLVNPILIHCQNSPWNWQ